MVLFNIIDQSIAVDEITKWSIRTLLIFAIIYLWKENNKKDKIIENKDNRIKEVISNHMMDKDAHTNKIESITKTAYQQVKEIINELKGILEK